MIVIGFAFVISIILLEMLLGIAAFGFTGGKAFQDRESEPAKYWFSIALQIVFGLILPGCLYFFGDRIF